MSLRETVAGGLEQFWKDRRECVALQHLKQPLLNTEEIRLRELTDSIRKKYLVAAACAAALVGIPVMSVSVYQQKVAEAVQQGQSTSVKAILERIFSKE